MPDFPCEYTHSTLTTTGGEVCGWTAQYASLGLTSQLTRREEHFRAQPRTHSGARREGQQ